MCALIIDEYREIQQAARKFTQNVLEPFVSEIESTGTIPPELIKQMAKHGYLGMRLDERFGGAGLSIFPYCLVLEEFSRSHRIFTLIASGTSGLTPTAIALRGTPQQQQKYLPGMVRGELSAAFALTEPEAGSDAAGMKTRASKIDGGWVINGSKHYISGGHTADFLMVMAVTDPDRGSRGGISAFLVDKGAPGFSVTRVDKTIASDVIQLATLSFEKCEVPDSALIGEVGGGFKLSMESLTEGRLGISCSCIGVAERVLADSVEHAKQRVTFGKKLSQRQAIQWMLADTATEIEAARALTYQTINDVENGLDVGTRPSMCKLYCSEMVGRAVDRAVQVHGGMGVIRGVPVERFYRDVRHYRVGEGTSEIQRILISRGLFGREERNSEKSK